MNFGHCASPAAFNVVTRAIQWIVDTQPTDWWLRDGRGSFSSFRARAFDSATDEPALQPIGDCLQSLLAAMVFVLAPDDPAPACSWGPIAQGM